MNQLHTVWNTPITDDQDQDFIGAKTSLPAMEERILRSFPKNSGKDKIYLWSYQTFDNLPDGIILKDASELLDSSLFIDHLYTTSSAKFTKNERIKLAQLSDLIRYAAVAKYGGWYLDLDVILVKPLPDLEPGEHFFTSMMMKRTGRYVKRSVKDTDSVDEKKWGDIPHAMFPHDLASNSTFAAPKGSKMMKSLASTCISILKKDPIAVASDFVYLMKEYANHIREFDLSDKIAPSATFAPFPYFGKRHIWFSKHEKDKTDNKADPFAALCYGAPHYYESFIRDCPKIYGVQFFSSHRDSKYGKSPPKGTSMKALLDDFAPKNNDSSRSKRRRISVI